MHSAVVVFVLLLLMWNSTALHCDDSVIYDVSGVSQPDEILFVTFGDEGEIFEQPVPVLTSSDDDGEVVESADNVELPEVTDWKSDTVSSSDSQSQELVPDIEDDSEVVEVTTEAGAR